MPWNGSGVFNRVYSWVADKNGGLDIIASRMDTDTDDITLNGFGNCITRDGQGQPTASIIPNTTDTYDLGSVSFTWRHGFFGGNLSVGGNATVSGAAAVHTTVGGWTGNAIFEALSGGGATAPALSGYTNSPVGVAIQGRVDATTAKLAQWNIDNIATVGSITTDGSSTAYNTSSDVRLKDNIQDAGDAGGIIDALRVRSWDWKVNGKHEAFGFVAQEEVLVAPFAVHAGDSNPDEIEDHWGRDDSKLVPLLVKEIQALRLRIAALEQR